MIILKKALLILVSLGLLVLLASCSEGEEGVDDTPVPSPTEDASTPDDTSNAIDYSNFVMDYSAGIDDNGFWTDISAYDYIEPFNYLGIEIPYDSHFISDESVQTELNYLLDSYVTPVQVTDREVLDGDTVNIDFVGSIDGVEFEGGSTAGSGTSVTIGVTSYIDGFLEQLIGHTPGETFDINVTFPEDYGQDNLNGKDAVFITTVNYIEESVRPELTDEFVATNLYSYGWMTVADVMTGITDSLSASSISSFIKDYIVSNVTVLSLPESIITYQRDSAVSYYINYAASYGMDIDTFLSMYLGFESVEVLLEMSAADIEINTIYLLALQAIAEDLELLITETDLQNYFYDTTGSSDYSEYVTVFGHPYIAQAVLIETVSAHIMDNAVYLEQ